MEKKKKKKEGKLSVTLAVDGWTELGRKADRRPLGEPNWTRAIHAWLDVSIATNTYPYRRYILNT